MVSPMLRSLVALALISTLAGCATASPAAPPAACPTATAAPIVDGMVDVGGLRTFHAQVKEKPGRKPLREIKVMKDDAAAVEKQADDIKTRYAKYFKV